MCAHFALRPARFEPMYSKFAEWMLLLMVVLTRRRSGWRRLSSRLKRDMLSAVQHTVRATYGSAATNAKQRGLVVYDISFVHSPARSLARYHSSDDLVLASRPAARDRLDFCRSFLLVGFLLACLPSTCDSLCHGRNGVRWR